jgi:nucleoside-diphosphate kinase
MPKEITFLFIKPDAVQRGLAGNIISRIEAKGLTVVASKMILVSPELATQHYAEHAAKPFFPGLLAFITSSPVIALAVRGVNAVTVCRNLIGATNGQKAAPGTIRGDLGMSGGNNLIHGSDSPESAAKELAMWFKPEEILSYDRTLNQWVYDPSDL